MGKIEDKLIIDQQAFNAILNRYTDVQVSNEHLQLDYDSMQLYFALEALRLYMEDHMLSPNYEVNLDEQ